jgi:RES domain-containing protein
VRLLWRISKHNDLDGLAGEKTDGRWHTAARGKRIVYLSEHPALALIEVLANLKGNPKLFPDTYQIMKVTATDTVPTETLNPKMLASGWRENIHQTRAVGDSWIAKVESALLAVPSAPSPESWNYLFNPLHFDAKDVTIEWCKWIEYDKRLFHIHERGDDQV